VAFQFHVFWCLCLVRFNVDTRNWWECNIIFCLLREILRIVWKLIVPWEYFDQNCSSTFEFANYTLSHETYFLFFFIMQNNKLFSNWKFRFGLTSMKKGINKKIFYEHLKVWFNNILRAFVHGRYMFCIKSIS
jgi:hypothetical protein